MYSKRAASIACSYFTTLLSSKVACVDSKRAASIWNVCLPHVCLIARFGAFSEWGLKLLVYEALTCLIARFGAFSEACRMLCFSLMGP